MFAILIWPAAFIIALIVKLIQVPKMSREMYPGRDAIMDMLTADTDEPYECEECEEEEEQEELHFCQLFTIGPDMCLLIDHIEMCPDEVAFIRVVDDEGYTPLYKRKVRRDKAGNRFIVFNSTNHYLDDKKTQPVIKK
jgi:hypothetical protein